MGDQVLLKVLPTKGIVRFRTKGKLSPCYVGPFPVVARVGKLSYRIDLPQSMRGVHNVSHVSMLRKYFEDSFFVNLSLLSKILHSSLVL